MTEGDFHLTRRFLRNYVLHYAPTTMGRLGYALDDRFYGIAGSHLELFRKMMGEITLEEVNAAIRKHWQYGNMQIAVITKNAEAFQQALVSGTPSPITYKNAKPESVLREDKEIEVFPVPVKKENVRVVKVTGVLEQ